MRTTRWFRWLVEFRQDLGYAFRILAKSPGFTVVSVLMLALGIGANTAIVSAIDALVFRQLPFGAVDRLVTIEGGSNFPNYLDIRADTSAFSGVAAFMGLPLEARTANLEILSGKAVSANFFQVLGLRMALGRGFVPEEENLAGSQPVVVLSYHLWERSFSKDPAIVGKTLRLNGEPLVIVGVAPKDFRDVDVGGSQDVWVPIPMFARVMHSQSWDVWHEALEQRDLYPWLGAMARLKPGVAIQQARARMAVLASDIERACPGYARKWNWHPTIAPVNRIRWPEGNALFFSAILAAAGLCLLLITCTNIANLLLARASVRRREMATRLALGARRGRIVRQLLAEGLALSALALIFSLLVYHWTLQLLPAFENSFGSPFSFALGMDRRTLLFAISIGLVTNIIFGLAPALIASGTSLTGALRNQVWPGLRPSRIPWRKALVVIQIVLTVILLIGAGVFIRTVWHFESVDPGFDRNLLLVSSDFILSGGFEIGTRDIEKQAVTFFDQTLESVREISGIRSASWAADIPYQQRGYIGRTIRPEQGGNEAANWLNIHCNSIGTDYFKTMGIPILRGRDFHNSDRNGPMGVVIVNETLARRYWPGQSPIGKRIRVKDENPELSEVVGVAKDIRYQNPWDNARPYAYFPYWQASMYGHQELYVQALGDPMNRVDAIKRVCQSINPKVTMLNPRLLAESTASLLSQERASASVLTVFGLLALVLAAMGLYGVISYSVAQRTHEFGIRLALGAKNGDILRQVIFEGTALVAVGLAIGLPCSMALSRFVVNRMHGLSPLQPGIYAGVSVLSLAVALCAVVLPARRALVNPMVAIRVE